MKNMKKVFLECNYRIDGIIYNEGYICINDNEIIGIFTYDHITIIPDKSGFTLKLKEYNIESSRFYEPKVFYCHTDDEVLESPKTYTFRCSSGENLLFEIKKKVTDPKNISQIKEIFENFPF